MEADRRAEPFLIAELAGRAEEDVWVAEAGHGAGSSTGDLPELGDCSEGFAGVWHWPSPFLGERHMKSRAERGREALSLGWDHLAGASGGGMAFA